MKTTMTELCNWMLNMVSKACNLYAIEINNFTVDPPLKGKISKAIILEKAVSLKSSLCCRLYAAISLAFVESAALLQTKNEEIHSQERTLSWFSQTSSTQLLVHL